MLRLFDTHCHFETTDRETIRAQLERAKAAGVERLMAVGGSSQLNESAAIAAEIAGDRLQVTGNTNEVSSLPVVTMSQGLDRDQIVSVANTTVSPVVCHLSPDIMALGEIGLDYHYSPETRAAQVKLFSVQLEAARKQNLPVIIHTREADDDTLGLLREIPSRGVIHCYTGAPDFARKLLDLGFYISISGIVTFKSAENVRETVRMLPNDRILIETDSPYLAPVPMRGQPNEPAFIVHTCEFLAKLRGTSAADFADLTFGNGEKAFQ